METWQGANLSFWLITVMVLVSGALAAFARNIVQAAFALFFTLIGMAGYYVLLGSDFLAITQVVIYVGGILVLLIFGVLLTIRPLERPQRGATRLYLLGGAAGAAMMAGVLWTIIRRTPWPVAATLADPAPTTRVLGRMLLGEYLLPFELAGMTLLLCLVGAAYLVRRKER
jgi:NADH-quinone oxidoreductase subunit J